MSKGDTAGGETQIEGETFGGLAGPSVDGPLALGYGLDFEALHSDAGLERLNQAFWDEFDQSSLNEVTSAPADEPSAQLLKLARASEHFLARLFGLVGELDLYRQRDLDFSLLQTVKYKFVKRKAMLGTSPEAIASYDPAPARLRWLELGIISPNTQIFDELLFAKHVRDWQGAKEDTQVQVQADLECARQYSAWASLSPKGQHQHRGQVLFDHAKAVDPAHMLHDLDDLPADIDNQNAGNHAQNGSDIFAFKPQHRVIKIKAEFEEPRQGFGLSDAGPQAAKGLDQAKYCLICHPSKTDSCSHGLHSKDSQQSFALNAHGMPLTGCPLGEKISEFQLLRRESRPIAALAMITRDNPMVAATGHRICNDCSRACVFQQQTPVDIPASETRILEDVLALPWGVEIYSLLTRWNPLRSLDRESILGFSESMPRRDSGKKILVTGLGPSGFTLAHHLLNLGHQVLAIDGQKIEPLPQGLLERPIKSWEAFQESLATRIPAGFGGVAEYGITVRWNKNYLKLIRLLLERRSRFRLQGGVRLGAQVSIEQAFELGFDHIALALGAGKPKLWEQKNVLPKGVRMASDFLMALQLTGAYREDSLAGLQIELPAVVIGAGLTAVDTATEALAYYALQVERFAKRHRDLRAARLKPQDQTGQEFAKHSSYLETLTPEEKAAAEKFIAHGEILLEERRLAASEGRPPNLLKYLQAWGGVTLIYRRKLEDSPAYRLNHEELQKGLAEGIWLLEGTEVLEVQSDPRGALMGLRLKTLNVGHSAASLKASDTNRNDYFFEAKSAFLAIGTDRNDFLKLSGSVRKPFGLLNSLKPDSLKPASRKTDSIKAEHLQASLEQADARQADSSARVHLAEGFGIAGHPGLSILGDMHPSYAGSVVKAMASAARASILIDDLLAERFTQAISQKMPGQPEPFEAFSSHLKKNWGASIADSTQFRKGIVELGLHAPAAATNFQPGQFFKLQNFESGLGGSQNAAEPMAMTGASADPKSGRLSTIILQNGSSSALTTDWGLGQDVVLMGPCGLPSEIPSRKKVLLVGGGLGNAVLFSIGQACRAQGCEVVYIAAYRNVQDMFHQNAIEAAADHVIWCFESLAEGAPRCRMQDRLLTGNVLEGLRHLQSTLVLPKIEHLLVIGSQAMMAALANACRSEFSAKLHPQLKAIASVNAPMQCMMQGICGQCLQVVRDPATGQNKPIFTCEAQDQPLLDIDFDQLKARLSQNRILEVQHLAWQSLTQK